MAAIERITLPTQDISDTQANTLPGLRISIRSTTSSLSDYPEWKLEEILGRSESVITDGACS